MSWWFSLPRAGSVRAMETYQQYRQFRAELPDVRLYYVEVPPSLNLEINQKANRFNRAMSYGLGSDVTVVKNAGNRFAANGGLDPRFARACELAPDFEHHRRLHLNQDGQRLVVVQIKKALSRSSNVNLR